MSDSALESQVCDDASRIELQRLELILSGGLPRFVRMNLIFIFVPILPPMLLAQYRWLLWNHLYYVVPIALILGAILALGIRRQWRLCVERAAAIRAGASFAAPANLKDHLIFQITTVFIGLFSAMLSEESLFSSSDFTRIGHVFLFIAAVVFALWSLGKAIIGYRTCPPAHLRRGDLLGGIYSGVIILLILGAGATWSSSLPAVVEFFVSRTAPNYLVPAKP